MVNPGNSVTCDADPAPEASRWLRNEAFVAGSWCQAADGSVIDVVDPATECSIGTVPSLGGVETRRAIEAAKVALPGWKRSLPATRANLLRSWLELIRENRESLAQLMTLEQGKPLAEARGEIDYAAGFIQWFAEEASRAGSESIPSHLEHCKLMVQREPIGVVATVTPWNFPAAMLTRKAAAALAVGCTVVAFASPETPFSALALAALAQRAGFPDGVLSVLTGDPETVVGELCASSDIRALSFTGSTEVGRLLMAECAPTVKKVSLELGGHAPFIVFDDADLDKAVVAAIDAKFQTSGQDCLAANRIFVHDSIYDEFLARFSLKAGELRVGRGFQPDVDIGPLINPRAVAKCAAHVKDAIAQGAVATVVGGPTDLGARFFAPAVLSDVTSDMRIYREETFGPVAPLIRFRREQEVLDAANDTEYGLIAYVFTENNSRAFRASDALEYGMVAVNTAKVTGPGIPFGGFKQSGLGREGSRHGMDEFSELKYVCMAI